VIRRALVWLGRRMKGELFAIDPGVPASALVGFAVGRGVDALRGVWLRIWLGRGSAWPVFVGARVRVSCARRVVLGRGVTLGEGVVLRGLSRAGVRLGDGVSVGAGTVIVATSVLRELGEGCVIGRNSGIGQFGFIGCGGGVEIGANVIMGQYVSFHTQRHRFEDPARPIVAQGVERCGIVIGDDVWVGAKATFLPGAVVGRGSVVAAGAVVRGVVPEGAIVAGVPARVIGWRPGFGGN